MKKKRMPDPDKPLTAAEFKKLKWMTHDELPLADRMAIEKFRGRPKLANPKEHINIRLDADIVAKLRSFGPGWQTKLNDDIRKLLS